MSENTEQGKEKELEGARRLAKAMLIDRIPIPIIEKYADLPVEEIRNVAKENNLVAYETYPG